ncbi:hypothetical protein [Mucilaginibacter sp.]|uniref:hypothetical protein n=1 Tax=Mucilaginibacter sp. TaxID=1882438 RepID=UPI003262D9C0
MKKLFTPKVNGYLVANAVGFAIIGISKYLSGPGSSGVLIYSEFIIVPFLVGIISAWFWRDDEIGSMVLVSRCVANCFVAIVLSALFLREGAICLIIVSPLLWTFIVAGCFTGRAMFRRNNNTLNASVLAMLLVLFVIDSTSVHHYENMVADRVVINAPVSRVWKNVVAYKRNASPDKYWLFKVGMPSPVESTTEGYYVGAKRKCIFSNGYVFDEKIVVYEENKNLTFDITGQPRDPEIMGHIDILRGQFLLRDNGDNTTTVIGNSWYRLYVFPVWYYDIWAKSVTRNVHLRVMEHIKQISEAQ